MEGAFTAEELARLRVRWALLAHLGKPCQVAQEMRHALERHHGRLPKDDDAWARLHFAAYDLKLYDERPTRSPNGVLMPDGDVAEILFRAPGASPTSLIIDITNGVDDANRLGRGLANLTLACAGYGEQDRIDALVELRQAIERLGLAKVRAQADGTTIGEELEVLELDARVRVEGMSARIAARIEKLLAGQDGHSSLQSDARMVIGNAEYVESHRLLKQDLDYATVYAWLHAGPDGGDLLDLSTPACAPLKTVTWNTKRFDGVMEDGAIVLKEYSHTVNALIDAHALRRVGCVKGVKGDLTTAAQALAWMDTFPNRFIATADVAKCTEDHQELVKSMRHTRTPRPDAPEAWAFTIVQAGVRRMVSTGCAQR